MVGVFRGHVPTRTDVLLDSSSDAREVPPFLGFEDMDRRLEDRGLRCIIMLMGRGTPPPVGGEAGGEAMVVRATARPSMRGNCAQWCREVCVADRVLLL